MRRPSALVTSLALAAAAAALVVVTACDSNPVYAFNAREYDSARDCLGEVTGLDVLQGNDPGLSCPPRCIVGHDVFDGSVVLLGTTQCGQVPYGFDDTATNPLCPDVIAALQRSDVCGADGGSSNPRDAGAPDASDASDGAMGDAATGDASDAQSPDASDAASPADAATSADAATE